MNDVITIIILTGLAGACIPLGGTLAQFAQIRPLWMENELRHFIIAFGGGILLGAVAFVLVPQGISSLGESIFAIVLIVLGAIVFFLIERSLGLRRREAPQLMGIILDYIPEAIALGGLVAVGSNASALLAFLIAIQNLPEGFNAYRELHGLHQISVRKKLTTMILLVPLGPIAGVLGYYFLAEHESILGGIMLFSAGGIVYLIFQDIAPQARLEKHWAPPLGAVFGFCLALLAELLVMH